MQVVTLSLKIETDMEAEKFSTNSVFQRMISQKDLIAYSYSESVKF